MKMKNIPKLTDAMKAVLSGKFITINTCIKKTRKISSHLILQFKELKTNKNNLIPKPAKGRK